MTNQGQFEPRNPVDRVIVALDVSDWHQAWDIVNELGDSITFYKIGLELATNLNLNMVRSLIHMEGKRVFVDLKLLDIDNTVARAVSNISRLGATFTTVHAYKATMRAAVAAKQALGAEGAGLGLLGVTVLTSMDDGDLANAGYLLNTEKLSRLRATQAMHVGMDGLICSPHEVHAIKEATKGKLKLITPGIRPIGTWGIGKDQKRFGTPASAILSGADYIVVGRPITQAEDRKGAASEIVSQVSSALWSMGQ